MAPNNHPSSPEINIIVALMEQVESLRADIKSQTELISAKLDAQTHETRGEFKDLREDISDIKARLAGGSERIATLRKDVDRQADRCREHNASALERKHSGHATTVRKGKSAAPAWWLVLLIGGAMAWGGERLAKFVINGIADPPPAAGTLPAPTKP